MANVTYNVAQLFSAAFGINSPVFITQDFKNNAPASLDFSGVETTSDYERGNRTSWMGTPIIFGATFKGGTYRTFTPNGQITNVALNDLNLPPATMFSFRRAKNIERTQVSGGNGTVKEIYGFDDWVIDGRGLILPEPEKSPEEQLKELLAFDKLADGIGVSGQMFEIMEISRLCITEFSHELVQGKNGVIAFRFQMISDEDIILLL